MTKQEFLTRLRNGLSGLPQSDVAERLSFYSEMIDDSMEEGLSEEEAVDEIGPVENIIEQTVSDIPLSRLVKERVKPQRKLKAWEIVLLVLGSPVWIPLVAAAAVVVLWLYIVLWAGVAALWAMELSFALGSVAGIPTGLILIFTGNGSKGWLTIGSAFILAGLAIILFFGCREATKGTVIIAKRFTSWVKTCFIRKENNR